MTADKTLTVKVGMREKYVRRIQGLAAERDRSAADEIDSALILYLTVMKHMRSGSHIEIVHKDGSGIKMTMDWNN